MRKTVLFVTLMTALGAPTLGAQGTGTQATGTQAPGTQATGAQRVGTQGPVTAPPQGQPAARPAGQPGNGSAVVRGTATPPATRTPAAPVPRDPATPPDYVIGADDLLSVVFWREQEISGDVVVRPDGKISLPLVNDVHAAGLTPDELRLVVEERARQFVEAPNATVIVRQINSRKVFITGQVVRPGPYPLTGAMTVLQLIATSGGLTEYADKKRILILRPKGHLTETFEFNHDAVVRRQNLAQNILLRPGDTVVVP